MIRESALTVEEISVCYLCSTVLSTVIIKVFYYFLVLYCIKVCIRFNFKYYIFCITANYLKQVKIYSGIPHSSSSRR